MDTALDRLRANFAQAGVVQWIGLRTARDMPMREVDEAYAQIGTGLRGDRYNSTSGKRGITLIQAEHLPVIAALSNRSELPPAMLRRNVVVSGIPLLALMGKRFQIGEAVFETTVTCDPCERMEQAIGIGAYNAMTGHGGICARIVQSGSFKRGDQLTVFIEERNEGIAAR